VLRNQVKPRTFGLLILFGFLFSVTASGLAQEETGRVFEVVTKRAILHKGPSYEYPILGGVRKGTRLTFIKQEGTWLNVLLEDDTEGWIGENFVREISPETPPEILPEIPPEVPPELLPIVKEKVPLFDTEIRNYAKLSGYYDGLKDNPIVNPDNVLEKEESGFFLEINTQFQFTLRDNYSLSGDVSYQYCPGPGDQAETETHLITNEFYLDLLFADFLNVKLGKKRETWGVGNTFNPIDIINPPKDPVDPSESREGSYIGLIEVPFKSSIISVVAIPDTWYEDDDNDGVPDVKDGIPEGFKSDNTGYGMRLYSLVWDTDISFIYYNEDIIPEDAKDYFGLAYYRFFGYLGTYFELLGHEGSNMMHVQFSQEKGYYLGLSPELENDFFVNHYLGSNYTFGDSTKIGMEYYHNSEGYDEDEFNKFHTFLNDTSQAYLASSSDPETQANLGRLLKSGVGLMQKPIRQQYVVLMFERPNTFDDFFPHLNAIMCLDDSSFQLSAALDYNIRDDLTITLDTKSFFGDEDTEYGLKPDDFKVTMKLKYYF